jgi:hypothetical protein
MDSFAQGPPKHFEYSIVVAVRQSSEKMNASLRQEI